MFTQNEEHGNEFLFIFGQVRKNIDIENKRLKINGKKNIVIGNKIKLGKKNSIEKKIFTLAKKKHW
jgi:hypothetical protein